MLSYVSQCQQVNPVGQSQTKFNVTVKGSIWLTWHFQLAS